MTSLLDQSTLTDLAESLVAAARKAGADAADAVAVRSVSAACRSARRRGRGIRALRKRRSRPARVRRTQAGGGVHERYRRREPGDACRARRRHGARGARRSLCGLGRRGAPDAQISRSRSRRSGYSRDRASGKARARGRASRARGQGRDQIRRRVGLGRDRRHGAGHHAWIFRRLSRLAAFALDDGDRRRRHRDGARLRLLLQDARGRSRFAAACRHGRGRAHGQARQSAQGPHAKSAGDFRSARRGLADRPSGQRRQWRIGGAQDRVSCARNWARRFSRPASASSTIRWSRADNARIPSTAKA